MQYTMHMISFGIATIACLQACGASDNEVALAGQDSSSSSPKAQNAETHKKGYVGLFGDGAVGVIDLETLKIIKTIPVTAPDGLVVTPDGKQVFVSSTDQGAVVVISTENDSITTSIDVGSKPAGLTVTPDGKRVIASVGGADAAVIIDVGTLEAVGRVPVKLAHSSCVTNDGHFAYVGSQVAGAPAIVKVDLTGAASPQSYPVSKSPRALACESGGVYFTAAGLDAVEVLDPSTGMVSGPIETGGSPHDVRRAGNRQVELVVSQTAGDLELIDTGSHVVVDRIPTGKLAHWIAVSADGKLAYVTNEADGSVSIVDLDAHSVTVTFAVGDAPRKIDIQR